MINHFETISTKWYENVWLLLHYEPQTNTRIFGSLLKSDYMETVVQNGLQYRLHVLPKQAPIATTGTRENNYVSFVIGIVKIYYIGQALSTLFNECKICSLVPIMLNWK